MYRIWVLVQVKRGLIDEPEIFFSLKEANKREKELLKEFNRDYDEIQVLEKELNIPAEILLKEY